MQEQGRQRRIHRAEAWTLLLLQPALAALAACTSQPAQAPAPPLPPLDLLGYRVLARAVSGATLPGFDEEAMPMLRVQGTARTSWRVQLVDATRTESVLAPATETRGQATLLRLTLAPGQRPPGEGPGELQLQDGDGAVLRRWPLLWSTPPEQHPVLAQAARLRKEGRFAEASQTLQQALSQPDAGRRYWGLVEQARLVQAERGAAAAGAAWGRGAEAAGQAGLPSEVGRCLRASAYLAYNGGRHEEALALLAQEEQARHGLDDPVGAAQASYVRGLVLQELGDYRRALEQLRRARDEAWALGLDTHWLWSMEMLADLLQLLGRHGEARQTLEQAGAFFARPGADPELRAHYLVNRGWLLLRGMAEGGEPLDPVEPLTCFEQALQLGGHDLGRRANVLVNIAWLELLRGQPAQARQRIAEARALGGEALEPVELFVALLEPELLLAEGKLEEARQGFVQAEARAREELGGRASPSAWQASYGLGRVLQRQGRPAEALAALLQALALLEKLGQQTTLQEDRAPFFANHRALVEDSLALLLQQGDVARALVVADAAQANVLRGLQAAGRLQRLSEAQGRQWALRVAGYRQLRDEAEGLQARLKRSAGPTRQAIEHRLGQLRDTLAQRFDEAFAYLDGVAPISSPTPLSLPELATALRPDEALLELAPLGQRWIAFWLHRGELAHRVLPPEGALLAPWREQLAGLRHLFVVDGGHRAASRLVEEEHPAGGPLLEQLTLSFLPHAGFLLRRPARLAPGLALVVADPGGDLPGARAEGEAVARSIPGARMLAGRQARRSEVLPALHQAALLHFAGHGRLHTDSPWDAHLQLAEGERLTLADLFAEHPAIGVVVLSGCETGQRRALSRWERVGLPAAFLAAGAQAVLASDRPVDDAQVRRFIERFYAAGGARAPGAALRQAALAARREGSELWKAIRLEGWP